MSGSARRPRPMPAQDDAAAVGSFLGRVTRQVPETTVRVAALARFPPGLGRRAVAGGVRVPRTGRASPTMDWGCMDWASPTMDCVFADFASPTMDWGFAGFASPTMDWGFAGFASPTMDWELAGFASPTIDRGALEGVTGAKEQVVAAACTPPVTNVRHAASCTRPVGRSGRSFAASWAGVAVSGSKPAGSRTVTADTPFPQLVTSRAPVRASGFPVVARA